MIRAVFVLALSSACSFAVVRPSPAPAKRTQPPSCRSSGWILLDVLGALATGGAAWLSTARFEGSDPSEPKDHSSTYVFGGAAVVLGASAIYGIAANVVCTSRADTTSNVSGDP